MQPHRRSAASLAVSALVLLSCQIIESPSPLPAVSAAPASALEAEVMVEPVALVVEPLALEVEEAPSVPEPALAPEPELLPLDVVEARLVARARSLTTEEIVAVADAIRTAAERHELPVGLVLAVIEVESQFDAFAVSRVGAMGLMQIVPNTGEALARRYGVAWNGPRTLFDPVINVTLGIAYLSELQRRFEHWPTALAAYNWGPTTIGRRLHRGAPIPAGYARRVLATQARRAESEARTS